MILRFEVEIGYKRPPDVLILSKNLGLLAMEDPSIIDKKLEEEICLKRVVLVPNPSPPFISSPLGLVPKHDGDFRQIHHLSHSKGKSVNNHIADGVGELRYTRFQESFNLILDTDCNSIVIKRDIKDAFRNVPIAPWYQWLLGFMWRNSLYKETCLSFSLVIAPFILNFLSEGFHSILVSSSSLNHNE